MAAREVSPGRWFVIAHLGEPNGEITFVRLGDQNGYRVDRTDDHGVDIHHVGYFTTLKRSAWEIHSVYLRSHGAPNIDPGLPQPLWDDEGGRALWPS
jgi:hypothetical protein